LKYNDIESVDMIKRYHEAIIFMHPIVYDWKFQNGKRCRKRVKWKEFKK